MYAQEATQTAEKYNAAACPSFGPQLTGLIPLFPGL
jgi:hypothetical protein